MKAMKKAGNGKGRGGVPEGTRRLTFDVPIPMWEALVARAAESGNTAASTIRLILSRGLEIEKSAAGPVT